MTSRQASLTELSDDQLLLEVRRLADGERHATAALLRSLIELDVRRLYLREGCSSLFTYCTQVLHLEEGAAYNRIETARAARRFPSILDHIADGSLTLTSARLLAPHLTPENLSNMLASARHRSKREVELLVASLVVSIGFGSGVAGNSRKIAAIVEGSREAPHERPVRLAHHAHGPPRCLLRDER